MAREGGTLDGSFVHVCGVVTRNSIARHPCRMGALDILFNPNGQMPGKVCYALALERGGTICGRSFTNIGGQQRNYIAALDASNRVSDFLESRTRIAAIFRKRRCQLERRVYAGGYFSNIGGAANEIRLQLSIATTGVRRLPGIRMRFQCTRILAFP